LKPILRVGVTCNFSGWGSSHPQGASKNLCLVHVGLRFPTKRQYRYHVGSKTSNFEGLGGAVSPPYMVLGRLALANKLLSLGTQSSHNDGRPPIRVKKI
jgi:hypothetical protein